MTNKPTIKLYTEEQVKEVIAYYNTEKFVTTDELLKDLKLTPIELPSDEEIEEMGKDVIVYNDTKRGWFVEGLRFMRDKIGGNK
jgi:hypothetical protein